MKLLHGFLSRCWMMWTSEKNNYLNERTEKTEVRIER
jgi:hypothetical protein